MTTETAKKASRLISKIEELETLLIDLDMYPNRGWGFYTDPEAFHYQLTPELKDIFKQSVETALETNKKQLADL